VPLVLSNLRGRVVQATTKIGEFREEIENSGDLELVIMGPVTGPHDIATMTSSSNQLTESNENHEFSPRLCIKGTVA